MALEQLLGAVPLATFVEQRCFKTPMARAGGCRDFVHLASRETAERILAQADADVILAGPHEARRATLPLSPEDVARALADGYSIGIRHAQRHDAALAELAADFERDFLAPVDLHLYVTPAGRRGFGWHYDAEDVFILQTRGKKRWELRKNTVNPWPLIETLPDDMRHQSEIMPLLRCDLVEGDWLYIPTGYWHRTQADEESISLSVGIASRTGIDVLDFLRRKLLDSLRWRQRLPGFVGAGSEENSHAVEELAAHLKGLGEDLAQALADPATAAALLRSCRPRESDDRANSTSSAGQTP